jgi:8-oxo-dGTP pyrophosphatase MutT (NUDIX family)
MLPFNIRVYGLLVNDLGQVLVSDECRNGYSFTKFPGGGLEFGEGFKEALKREFIEELNISVDVGDLFYFNDFFQESAFNPKHQIHSFYYKVSAKEWEFIETNKHNVPLREEGEKHRWIAIDQLEINHFTFPIDKLVAEILRQKR